MFLNCFVPRNDNINIDLIVKKSTIIFVLEILKINSQIIKKIFIAMIIIPLFLS
jgi:hypothetical protein